MKPWLWQQTQRVVHLFTPLVFIPFKKTDSLRLDFCYSEVTKDIWEHDRND